MHELECAAHWHHFSKSIFKTTASSNSSSNALKKCSRVTAILQGDIKIQRGEETVPRTPSKKVMRVGFEPRLPPSLFHSRREQNEITDVIKVSSTLGESVAENSA